MPILVNSMDIVISVNRPSSFGEHSYTVKIYEAASCGVPIVATSLAASHWMTRGNSSCLFSVGDVDDLDVLPGRVPDVQARHVFVQLHPIRDRPIHPDPVDDLFRRLVPDQHVRRVRGDVPRRRLGGRTRCNESKHARGRGHAPEGSSHDVAD